MNGLKLAGVILEKKKIISIFLWKFSSEKDPLLNRQNDDTKIKCTTEIKIKLLTNNVKIFRTLHSDNLNNVCNLMEILNPAVIQFHQDVSVTLRNPKLL